MSWILNDDRGGWRMAPISSATESGGLILVFAEVQCHRLRHQGLSLAQAESGLCGAPRGSEVTSDNK